MVVVVVVLLLLLFVVIKISLVKLDVLVEASVQVALRCVEVSDGIRGTAEALLLLLLLSLVFLTLAPNC